MNTYSWPECRGGNFKAKMSIKQAIFYTQHWSRISKNVPSTILNNSDARNFDRTLQFLEKVLLYQNYLTFFFIYSIKNISRGLCKKWHSRFTSEYFLILWLCFYLFVYSKYTLWQFQNGKVDLNRPKIDQDTRNLVKIQKLNNYSFCF